MMVLDVPHTLGFWRIMRETEHWRKRGSCRVRFVLDVLTGLGCMYFVPRIGLGSSNDGRLVI